MSAHADPSAEDLRAASRSSGAEPAQDRTADAQARGAQAPGDQVSGDQASGGGEESSLSDVIERLRRTGEQGEVSLNDVLETFEERSLGVFLTVFGLIAAIPIIGEIPGVSILTATVMLLAIARSLWGGGPLRLPERVGARRIEHQRLDRALDMATPWAERVDAVLRERLTWFTTGRAARLTMAIASALLCLTFYPLVLVPFGVKLPAVAVTLLGLAHIARDGLMALAGYALAFGTAALLISTML